MDISAYSWIFTSHRESLISLFLVFFYDWFWGLVGCGTEK